MTLPVALPYAVVLDLETTGLDLETCTILEVGAIAVDKDWNELDRFHSLVYYAGPQPRGVQEMHTKNGLWDECAVLSYVTVDVAAARLALWLKSLGYGPGKDQPKAILAGTGIDFDLGFLRHHMPAVCQVLHYRKIDLRSLFLFAENADLGFKPAPSSECVHRAMPDCESERADAQRLHELLQALDEDAESYRCRTR